MVTDEREDTTIYKVVINDEEQYSIWPADRRQFNLPFLYPPITQIP